MALHLAALHAVTRPDLIDAGSLQAAWSTASEGGRGCERSGIFKSGNLNTNVGPSPLRQFTGINATSLGPTRGRL
jgi:hypothetical protein